MTSGLAIILWIWYKSISNKSKMRLYQIEKLRTAKGINGIRDFKTLKNFFIHQRKITHQLLFMVGTLFVAIWKLRLQYLFIGGKKAGSSALVNSCMFIHPTLHSAPGWGAKKGYMIDTETITSCDDEAILGFLHLKICNT